MPGQSDLRKKTRRITVSGLLVAVMLVLGYVEHQFPSGSVPGIKLGLSNSVLIFAVYMLGIPNAFTLMALKVALSGFLFGGVSAMMYAFAGGLLSMIVMSVLSRVKGAHPVVVSMAGGVAHNAGQVALAMIVMETPKLMYYMVILMGVGMVCGLLTGVCADRVMKHLKIKL